MKLFIMEFLLHIAMTSQRFLDVSLNNMKKTGCTTLNLLSNHKINIKFTKQIRVKHKMKKHIDFI